MNRVQFVRLLVLGMLMLGLSSTTVWAGEPQTKTGTVKKVDATGKQIVVMVTRELTFTIADSTKITQGGADKKIADIKVDDKVSVEYVKDGDTRTAKRIVILGDK
ncbi:MAG: DUF5666 domain-containing protein [Kiritimatiellaeota bacterium]|nr:DUF5666 domain-containing protein [Kiritimatiellota bacterium]